MTGPVYTVWDKAKSLTKPSLHLSNSNGSGEDGSDSSIKKYLYNGNTTYELSQNFSGNHRDSYHSMMIAPDDPPPPDVGDPSPKP